MVVVDAEGATREFTTSDGATKAEAPEAQATAITADFIFRKGSDREFTKAVVRECRPFKMRQTQQQRKKEFRDRGNLPNTDGKTDLHELANQQRAQA